MLRGAIGAKRVLRRAVAVVHPSHGGAPYARAPCAREAIGCIRGDQDPPMPSALLPIFLVILVDVLGLTLILPLLPFYAERFGASPIVVGLLGATYAACQLLSGPVLGQLSDRYGRRPLLLVSQIGTFLGFLLLARAELLWMVFLSRIIDGATAGNLTIAQAYITDVTPPAQRARAFAVIGISFGVGFLIGPAISGWLAHYDPRWPVYAAAALSATSIGATALLLREPTAAQRDAANAPPAAAPGAATLTAGPAAPAGRRLTVFSWAGYAAYFRRPVLPMLLALFFCFAFSFSLFTSGFALFAERRLHTATGAPWGPREVGYVFAFSGLLGIFLQGGLVGRAVRRFGERSLVGLGFASAAVAYVVLGQAYALPVLLVSASLSALSSSFLRAPLTAMITQQCQRDEQGVVLGLTQSITSIAQIIGPLVAGTLIGRGWLQGWSLAAALPALVAFPLWARVPRSASGGAESR
jgi:DHA1 family tetracycline resistance protein-like MFS transporter